MIGTQSTARTLKDSKHDSKTVAHLREVSVEQARNEEQWNWHMETANRLDARLQERTTADLQQQASQRQRPVSGPILGEVRRGPEAQSRGIHEGRCPQVGSDAPHSEVGELLEIVKVGQFVFVQLRRKASTFWGTSQLCGSHRNSYGFECADPSKIGPGRFHENCSKKRSEHMFNGPDRCPTHALKMARARCVGTV